MILTIDGNESTFDDFIRDNSAEWVTPLTTEEVNKVKSLSVGESTYIGISEVKRIA